MSAATQAAVRGAGIGLAITLGLLILVNRPVKAEKAPQCMNQNTSVCETVERCSGGFEANGTCKWIYTITRYYWKY